MNLAVVKGTEAHEVIERRSTSVDPVLDVMAWRNRYSRTQENDIVGRESRARDESPRGSRAIDVPFEDIAALITVTTTSRLTCHAPERFRGNVRSIFQLGSQRPIGRCQIAIDMDDDLATIGRGRARTQCVTRQLEVCHLFHDRVGGRRPRQRMIGRGEGLAGVLDRFQKQVSFIGRHHDLEPDEAVAQGARPNVSIAAGFKLGLRRAP